MTAVFTVSKTIKVLYFNEQFELCKKDRDNFDLYSSTFFPRNRRELKRLKKYKEYLNEKRNKLFTSKIQLLEEWDTLSPHIKAREKRYKIA